MRKLCVIGDPIEHSCSPLIQTAMIRAAGLDFVYGAQQVRGTDTAGWLARAQAEDYVGFNATMPHKENLVPLMDELSAEAAMYRSVNTVCRRQGRWYGHSTDAEGLLRALREAGMDPAGRNVLVLGAGGAAAAVVLKLTRSGARSVRVANRTPARAQALCARDGTGLAQPSDAAPDTLKRLASDSRLVVNCTSLGMTGVREQFEDLSFLEELRADAGVFDLIYSPERTALLARAEQLGLRAANGLGMLIWQAVLALEEFACTQLDEPAMAAAARQALEGRESDLPAGRAR